MTTLAVDRKLRTSIKMLNYEQKKSLLGYINTILPAKATEDVYTIEQYNKELDDAEAEIERGEFYTNEEVFEMSRRLIRDGK